MSHEDVLNFEVNVASVISVQWQTSDAYLRHGRKLAPRDVDRRLRNVPKALVLPLIGDSPRLFHDGPRLARERFGKLGPVWQTWVLGQKTIVVGRADMIKWCLNREHDLLEGRGCGMCCACSVCFQSY